MLLNTIFDKTRFVRDTISSEFICKSCDQVLCDPVQCMKCKYLFCYVCAKLTYHYFFKFLGSNFYILVVNHQKLSVDMKSPRSINS